jgi:hypothetical protein
MARIRMCLGISGGFDNSRDVKRGNIVDIADGLQRYLKAGYAHIFQLP